MHSIIELPKNHARGNWFRYKPLLYFISVRYYIEKLEGNTVIDSSKYIEQREERSFQKFILIWPSYDEPSTF